MSFPNPAQRADWFTTQYENPAHRPAVAKVGAGWSAECGCPDARCERAANPTGRLYPTWDAAWHAARINLENAKEATT